MKPYQTISLIVSILILTQSCKKHCGDGFLNYYKANSFIKIMPDVDSVKVGDSIFVEITIPYRTLNLRDSSFVDASGLNMSEVISVTSILEWLNGRVVSNDVDKLKLISTFGSSKLETGKGISSRFSLDTNGYKVSYVIIPKIKGLLKVLLYPIEGRRDNRCTVMDFSSKIVNSNKRHYLLHQLTASDPSFIFGTRDESYFIKIYE